MDMLFPNLMATWRTCEIHYFLTSPDFNTDIYLSSYYADWLKNFAEESLIETFEKYYRSYSYLQNYNILIFNPRYNELNRFNRNGFNGISFNGKHRGDFLFTKEKDVNWECYQIGYSIFLAVHHECDWLIGQKYWPSVCKMYPSGGYVHDETAIRSFVNKMELNGDSIIVTQPFIFDVVSKCSTRVLKVYGAPLLNSDSENYQIKKTDPFSLHLCITSLGFAPKKGFTSYLELTEHFHRNYPTLPIIFHVVGMSSKEGSPPNLEYEGVLDPHHLNYLYENVIDIIVAPTQIDREPDGFPLGGEAMLKGCIPIQCDPYHANQYYGFDETNSLTTTTFDLTRATELILALYASVSKRQQMSLSIRRKVYDIFSPQKQLDPIARYFKTIASARQMNPRSIPSQIPDMNHVLRDTVINLNAKMCVQIGVGSGQSFFILAEATNVTGGTVIGFDTYTLALERVQRSKMTLTANAASQTHLDQIYSQVEHRRIREYPHVSLERTSPVVYKWNRRQKIDLLQIENLDRVHGKEILSFCIPMVRRGGMIIINNLGQTMELLPLVQNYASKVIRTDKWGMWKRLG